MSELPQSGQQPPDNDALLCIIGHVFLPPKLPDSSCEDELNVKELVNRLVKSFRGLKEDVSDEEGVVLGRVLETLKLFEHCHDEKGCIREKKVDTGLDKLGASDPSTHGMCADSE